MAKTTFVRKEIKYLINEAQKNFLETNLLKFMDYDVFCPNGKKYNVRNLYFDTPTFNVIRNSLSKPAYKAKLRVRTYNAKCNSTDTVFLEVKKKIAGVVNKRRIILSYQEYQNYLLDGSRPENRTLQQEQVFNEIDYLLKTEAVSPRLYLAYERIAMFAKDNPELRLTIDNNIVTRLTELNFANCKTGEPLLPEGYYLMEIKAAGSYPMWLVKLLSDAKIYPRSFSKYGTFYHNYIKEKIQHE